MTLLHGDCLDVMLTLPDASVDMVFADLPYGVTANKWDVVISLEPLWGHLLRVGTQRCAFIFTATQPFATTIICSQKKLFRYDLIWRKGKATGHLLSGKMPMRNHETLLVFYQRLPTYNPQMQNADKPVNRRSKNHVGNRLVSKNWHSLKGGMTQPPSRLMRMPYSVIDIASVPPQRSVGHPTQKPVALLEWLIKTYTNPGDTILDPTAGSGTTAIACINTNRKWICIEKDPTYCATAQQRIRSHRAAPQQLALEA